MTSERHSLLVGKRRLLVAFRIIVVLVVVAVGLAGACGVLWFRLRGAIDRDALVDRPDVREAAVAELVERAQGNWDSHPDPDVGRVLLPNLQARKTAGTDTDSNAFGLRERPFEVPKPPWTTRVIVLGDSFIFGAGVTMEERCGVYLENMLRDRVKGQAPPIEVLHVGMGSWNIRAETAYLRRNLENFRPDLVVQVLVSNDIDDSGTVRGFGGVASFTSQRPAQTTSFRTFWPVDGLNLGFRHENHLNHALGYESRRRFREAEDDLLGLGQAVERSGARFLVVLSWQDAPEIAGPLLLRELPTAWVTSLPRSFRADSRYRISSSDPHWNPAGHARVAQFLFGAISARDLLPDLSLEPWPEAAELFETMHLEGINEADPQGSVDTTRFASEITARVDMTRLDETTARQIDGGIQGDGTVAPYAALVLRSKGHSRLHLVGETLGKAELEGMKVEVFADEILLETMVMPRLGTFDRTIPLPAAIVHRPTFDLRFAADDFAYLGDDLRLCGAFRLQVAEVLP